MIKDRMTYRWLWCCLIAGGLLLAGCSDDSSEPSEQPVTPEQGSPLLLQAVTRTNGATQIGNASCPDIKAFLATESELMEFMENENNTFVSKKYGIFHYDSDATPPGWTSNITVKEERQYYMYGYMPANLSNETPTKPEGGNFSDGIDFVFNNLPDITTTDYSVIIGVQRFDGSSSELIGPSLVNVEEGNYSYQSGIVGKNYVNLLMGHLYSSLQLSFKIDDEYSRLRSIRLKEVTLNSTFGNVKTTVKIRKGMGVGTPTFTQVEGGSSNPPVEFLKLSDPPVTIDRNYIVNAKTLDKLVYCAPGIFDVNGTYVSITSTYDVLDKKGNSLGVRTSTNKLKITASSLVPGQKKNVVLTVSPTYLYVLSDGDLDNPVITIE